MQESGHDEVRSPRATTEPTPHSLPPVTVAMNSEAALGKVSLSYCFRLPKRVRRPARRSGSNGQDLSLGPGRGSKERLE